MLKEPLANDEARRLIRRIVSAGRFGYSRHARARMRERGLTTQDIVKALAAGYVEGCDLQAGSWRYRVVVRGLATTVAFRSEGELVVVSTWRLDP